MVVISQKCELIPLTYTHKNGQNSKVYAIYILLQLLKINTHRHTYKDIHEVPRIYPRLVTVLFIRMLSKFPVLAGMNINFLNSGSFQLKI